MSTLKITDFKSAWITNGITSEAIQFAEWFGEHLANKGLTNTQLRNIFGEVKLIESLGFEKAKTRFLLLTPKIAYTVKRNEPKAADLSSTALGKFMKVFNDAHDAVQGDAEGAGERFARFVDFMEAFLAYHRYYSPEKSKEN